MTSKTNRRIQDALLRIAALAALGAPSFGGGLTEFTNRSAYVAASGAQNTITFLELPADTAVTTQYEGLGITFTPGGVTSGDAVDVTAANPAFADSAGLNGQGAIEVNFSSPRTEIGCQFPGGLKIELWSGTELVGTTGNFGSSGADLFGGVISDQSFDRAILTDWVDGQVYIDDLLFDDSSLGTPYCFGDGSAQSCPCGNPGASDEGCANSSGVGAALAAGGTHDVGQDDLVLMASRLLPGQPALLFVGDIALQSGNGVMFGDGLRCAGGSIRRLAVAIPNATGEAGWGPGLGAAGAWMSGDTKRFQVWYRDPVGSPCGAGFNLTNGVELTFTP